MLTVCVKSLEIEVCVNNKFGVFGICKRMAVMGKEEMLGCFVKSLQKMELFIYVKTETSWANLHLKKLQNINETNLLFVIVLTKKFTLYITYYSLFINKQTHLYWNLNYFVDWELVSAFINQPCLRYEYNSLLQIL